MAEGGGDKDWKVANPSLYRRGREANLTSVPVEKLQKASEKGVRIDLTSSKPGEVKAQVDKIVVKGDDEI